MATTARHARYAAPSWGGAAALPKGVAVRPSLSRPRRERGLQHLVLALGVIVVVVLAWWLLFADDGPVRVLGCVWERANAEATATTDPACAP